MLKENEIIADLHIHSKYSRATSHNITLGNLVKYAKIKGLHLLGTGDFTHPSWLHELKQELKHNGEGVYYHQDFPFIFTTEISLIYSEGNKGRRVHLILLAPSLEIVEQINSWLLTKGRLDYDGRPIFGMSCIELLENLQSIDKNIEMIPAHCLLPDTFIHLNPEVKTIKDIHKGEKVLAHNGEFRQINQVYKRGYNGKIYKIVPWYFREGLATTPEHPFYVIKSFKKCPSTKGTCKPLCSKKESCKRRYFENYKPEWIEAKDIEVRDFLIYPRPNKVENIEESKITEFVPDHKLAKESFILPKNARNNKGAIKNKIKIDEDFCRLVGYFISEGYLIRREAVAFSFHANEKDYINEVISLMKKIFWVKNFKLDSRRENQGDIIFHSRILNAFFKKLFYSGEKARAWNKCLPNWMLLLPNQKIAEILRGWWRGDHGYTVSRNLMNQMKLICLKVGIIPSINIDSAENFNKRGKHFIGDRKIISERDTFIFSNLSFFLGDYGMLKEKCFRKFVNKRKMKHGWIDNNNVYLPVKKIEVKEYEGQVYNLEVEKDNSYVTEFATIHNCWTPWYGIFGSMSGFDSLKEAFQEYASKIHAIETGMSSDPLMNWRLSELNEKTIVSFSDAHSFWPFRLGREATIFKAEKGNVTYRDIIKQIRNDEILGTIETSPLYGKYHYDGHRLCNFSCSPEEALKLNNVCPICHKQLTIGVEHRVEELANQNIEARKNKKPFYTLLPLQELIALAKASTLASRKTWLVYNSIIERFGNEFNVLLNVEKAELIKALPNDALLVQLIIDNRVGNIQVQPGFDGQYGIPLVKEKQTRLL